MSDLQHLLHVLKTNPFVILDTEVVLGDFINNILESAMIDPVYCSLSMSILLFIHIQIPQANYFLINQIPKIMIVFQKFNHISKTIELISSIILINPFTISHFLGCGLTQVLHRTIEYLRQPQIIISISNLLLFISMHSMCYADITFNMFYKFFNNSKVNLTLLQALENLLKFNDENIENEFVNKCLQPLLILLLHQQRIVEVFKLFNQIINPNFILVLEELQFPNVIDELLNEEISLCYPSILFLYNQILMNPNIIHDYFPFVERIFEKTINANFEYKKIGLDLFSQCLMYCFDDVRYKEYFDVMFLDSIELCECFDEPEIVFLLSCIRNNLESLAELFMQNDDAVDTLNALANESTNEDIQMLSMSIVEAIEGGK